MQTVGTRYFKVRLKLVFNSKTGCSNRRSNNFGVENSAIANALVFFFTILSTFTLQKLKSIYF